MCFHRSGRTIERLHPVLQADFRPKDIKQHLKREEIPCASKHKSDLIYASICHGSCLLRGELGALFYAMTDTQ
jgi:hypothetical protein